MKTIFSFFFPSKPKPITCPSTQYVHRLRQYRSADKAAELAEAAGYVVLR